MYFHLILCLYSSFLDYFENFQPSIHFLSKCIFSYVLIFKNWRKIFETPTMVDLFNALCLHILTLFWSDSLISLLSCEWNIILDTYIHVCIHTYNIYIFFHPFLSLHLVITYKSLVSHYLQKLFENKTIFFWWKSQNTLEMKTKLHI